MKLRLGVKIIWIQAFSVVIFMMVDIISARWISECLGLSLTEANPLWFLELVPYILWTISLILIGAIWQIALSSEEKEGGGT